MEKQRVRELIQNGNIIQAKRELLNIEQKESVSDDIELLTMKASIAVAENNLRDAENYLLEGLLFDPHHDDVLFNLGYLYNLLGDYIQSNYYFKEVLIHSTDQELRDLIDQFLIENKQQNETEMPLVSIVILAYNKLEYTKLCIESILKYTSNINYELIAVNNGSTDGTKEYFDSLPSVRSLHLEQNVGVSNGFNEGMKMARGKYTASVCNDFIFTPRWLENLLICIESDETIGYVSPGASTISNLQQINGVYNNLEEMLEFAEKYNHSDPRKWEERVRLLPCVLMVRTELLKQIDYYDPRFYYGEFADDDISFRIRRAGYKLVYCKDTFTYHFGSVTVRDDQINNNSMNVSRDIFIEKYNMDSWSDAVFNPILLNEFSVKLSTNDVSILGVNTKCGGNPLQLKNMLREKGIENVNITNYCVDKKYLEDILTVSDQVIQAEIDQVEMKLNGKSFDYIIFEADTIDLNNNPQSIKQLIALLNHGGQLALSISYYDFNESIMNKHIALLKLQGIAFTYYKAIEFSSNKVELEIIVRKDA